MYKIIYVLLMLEKSGQILLTQRNDNASFGKNLWQLPGGRYEKGETATKALQREAQEELGIDIQPKDMELVHVVNRQGTENELMLLTFESDKWTGEPENKEVNKASDIKWFNINELPDNIIPAHKQALENIKSKVTYSEHGW